MIPRIQEGWPLTVLGFCLLCSTATGSETKETAALRAARDWLALVDGGDYDASRQAAAGYFRNATVQDQWRRTPEGLRRPLGDVVSREPHNTTYATELPGAPDGQYVAIQFTTAFENRRAAVETVTPMLEADGAWRVAGYFVRLRRAPTRGGMPG